MVAHLADVSIRSLLLAVIAAIALLILRNRRTAALQHAVWAAVVCGMLALFAFGQMLPRLSLQVLESPAVPVQASSPAIIENSPVFDLIPDANDRLAPATDRRSTGWRDVALYAYTVIALAFLTRFATGMFLVRRLLAKSNSLENFSESELIAVPLMVGWLHPKILLPLEWREWDREKLDAVMAHEGSHVRRHDGLVAAVAGVNRCIFWFHPLAWWLERRLAILAELACDESCVAAMGNRERYAQLLLEMARIVDESKGRLRQHALTMAAPSHIVQRIESILQEGRVFSRGLTWTGWAAVALCEIPLVWGAGTIALDRQSPLLPFELPRLSAPAPPAMLAQARPTPPLPSPAAPTPTPAAPAQDDLVFEVASVRALPPVAAGTNGGFRISGGPGTQDPERLRYAQAPIMQILARAFSMQEDQFVGPRWVMDDFGPERFEIIANVPPGATKEQVNMMVQNLLKERFHLAYHREKRNLEVYELTIAKNGPKLQDAEIPAESPTVPSGPLQSYKGDDGYPNLPPGWPVAVGVAEGSSMQMFLSLNYGGFILINPRLATSANLVRWRFSFRAVTLTQLMGALQSLSGIAHIVDHTGLAGKYDVKLAFAEGALRSLTGEASDPAPDIFSALEKQLGLKLQKTKAPLDLVVIDHIDKTPTEN